MSKVCWNAEAVEFLIEKVHGCESVWYPVSTDYKNKLKRQLFWCEIAKALTSKFPCNVEFSPGEVSKKWNNLKSYYMLNTSKLYKAKKSGASAEEIDVIEERWKHKSQMGFLASAMQPTVSVNNFNKKSLQLLTNAEKSMEFSGSSTAELLENVEDGGNCSMSPEPFMTITADTTPSSELSSPDQDSSHAHPKKKRRLAKKQNETDSLLEASTNLTNAIACSMTKTREPTMSDAFAKYIALKLETFDPDLRLFAESEITTIIMDTQAQQLQRSSAKRF